MKTVGKGMLTRVEGEYLTIIKKSIHQEDIAIINVYMNIGSKHWQAKEEIDKTIVGYFSTLLRNW